MADDKVKLPRSSYEELSKIIKAYGRLTHPASLDDVSKLCAMGKTVISANNSFLANIGVIEGGRAKSPTPKGSELATALEHEMPEQIQQNWSRVVRENEFLQKMGLAVRIRRRMESSALEAHIAYSAGEAKSAQVMTGARAVVDILLAAGVVREEDGQLVAGEPVALAVAEKASGPGRESEAGIRVSPSEVCVPLPTRVPPGISLKIELHIDAKPDELEGLGQKIKALLRDLQVNHDEGADSSCPGT